MLNLKVKGRSIGSGHPGFIVAEMSCNHKGSLATALQILEEAKDCGADAVKIQAYDQNSMTIDCDNDYFQIKTGPWAGQTLWSLYRDAALPWEYIPRLKQRADELGLILFPSVFSAADISRPELSDMPAWKVASFEITDHGLISHIAAKGKPVILSTGMATEAEIRDAVAVCRDRGNYQVALLKCTSAYPAKAEDANLLTMLHLAIHFGASAVGLSDHSLSPILPAVAVTLGASIVEKHFILSRQLDTPDAAFSLEPEEFRDMVRAVRTAEAAIGEVSFGPSEREMGMLAYRRSLFVVEDVKVGHELTRDNVKSIRPAGGLHPRYLSQVLGKRARTDVERGTPLSWEHLA